ncbi:hypothetical protein HYN48_09760 [Flavobacterium magnum]|uniref:DUF4595 domain-containing protein n=1 Tax=Flavobacterium magnum TaxID=2162713 RepID=A0A2S0RGC9_9FLAO|nr:hypothetical protein [Flavobacterium magnum]AWA30350.1 hypothetical protein HYN48_09760 [Flavobacterium magnum]
MRIRSIILVFVLAFSATANAQIISDMLSEATLEFTPKQEIDYVQLEFSGHGKQSVRKITYNRNLQVVSEENAADAGQAFKITREYDSINRLVKESTRSSSLHGTVFTYKKFSWSTAGAETLEYDKNGKLTSKSTIAYDSLMNPTEVVTFDANEAMIGREEAKYDYGDNIVEIHIYNHDEKLVGIHLTNIYSKNTKIPFMDYVRRMPFEEYRPLCTNWKQFEVAISERKYKLDKNNAWKSRTLEKLFYSPEAGTTRKNFNDTTVRKIFYKK